MNTSADNHDDGSELQEVMGAYFDALLHEAAIKPADVKQAVAPEARADLNPTTTTTVVAPLVAAMPVVGSDTASAVVESAEVCASTALPLEQSTVTGDQPAPPAVATDVLLAVPDTASVAVSAACEITDTDNEPRASAAPAYQLIQVGGLTLGIATDAITEIMALPTTTAPAIGAPAWALGSYAASQGVLTVVDTAALLVPNNARRITARGSHIVQLKGQRWALACDAIGDVLTPDPGQVAWRGAEGKRLWLAGTIRTPTCALLDISALIKLLEV